MYTSKKIPYMVQDYPCPSASSPWPPSPPTSPPLPRLQGYQLTMDNLYQELLDAPDSEDNIVFEEEVVNLMETSITSAMQALLDSSCPCFLDIRLERCLQRR